MDGVTQWLAMAALFFIGAAIGSRGRKWWFQYENVYDEIRYVGYMQRLSLAPNDVLVLSVGVPISDITADRLRESLEEKFGDRKIVVLGDGMKLGAVAMRNEVAA